MAEMGLSTATAKVGGLGTLADPKKANGGTKAPDDAFKQMLSAEAAKAEETAKTTASIAEKAGPKSPVLKFSNHALERMNTRGIFFTPDQITSIEQAAGKAAQKGAKEALVLQDDKALIVSLKNNTIVTVMDKDALKENVFTNIDSTVFA
jgi:flagellar operon protein